MDAESGKLTLPEPREEANVFKEEALTDDQKTAFRRVRNLVSAIAEARFELRCGEGAEAPAIDSVLPRIDADRRNNVILIDGGRGSGKTSVMLTVLKSWTDEFKSWTDEFRAERPTGRPTVFPLRVLDLQPLPESTELIVYVAGSLLRVIELLETSFGSGVTPGGLAPWQLEGIELPSRKAWREFVRAAAIGWQGNLPARRASLDPEAFALELEETERSRMDVIAKWTPLVDQLFCDVTAPGSPFLQKAKPVFVIPIDDADMNPARSVELLDLMRTLWHPRVVFLLTGDSDLFVIAAREYFLGALRKPLRNVAIAAHEGDRLDDVSQAVLLAGALYDRVIPLTHRCELPSIPLAKRMEVKLVRDVLQHIRTGSGERDHTKPPEEGASKPQTPPPPLYDVLKESPDLRKLLPDRMRDLVDFTSIIGAATGRDLRATDVVEVLRASLKHDAQLLKRHARDILDSIEILGDDVDIGVTPWQIVPSVPDYRRFSDGERRVIIGDSPRFMGVYRPVSEAHERRAISGEEKEIESRKPIGDVPLGETTTAALVLLKLLAHRDGSGHVRVEGDIFRITHDDPYGLSIVWSIPPLTFPALMLFTSVWRKIVIKHVYEGPGTGPWDWFAYEFLWLGLKSIEYALASRGRWTDAILAREEAPVDWLTRWHESVGELAQRWSHLALLLRREKDPWTRPMFWWLSREALLLLFPEAGVSYGMARSLLASLRGRGGGWLDEEQLRRARFDRIAQGVGKEHVMDVLRSFGDPLRNEEPSVGPSPPPPEPTKKSPPRRRGPKEE